MNWNDDDPFVKWVTRAYVIAVLIGMPPGMKDIIGFHITVSRPLALHQLNIVIYASR